MITIIILLILAGISIATLTNSGLFEKARQAEQKSENTQIKEEATLGDYENKIEGYVDGVRQSKSNSQFKTLWDEGITFSADTTWSNVKSEIKLDDSIENYDFFIIVGDHANKTSSGTYVYTVNDIVYNNSGDIKYDASQLIMTIAREATQTAIEIWFKDNKTIYINRAIHPESLVNDVRIRKIYGVKL